VFVAEVAGGIVAVFLEEMKVASDATKIGNRAGEFFWIGGELLFGSGLRRFGIFGLSYSQYVLRLGRKKLVTKGYQGLPGVTKGYQGLPGVTRSYQMHF
jgi:hypothetical protein